MNFDKFMIIALMVFIVFVMGFGIYTFLVWDDSHLVAECEDLCEQINMSRYTESTSFWYGLRSCTCYDESCAVDGFLRTDYDCTVRLVPRPKKP